MNLADMLRASLDLPQLRGKELVGVDAIWYRRSDRPPIVLIVSDVGRYRRYGVWPDGYGGVTVESIRRKGLESRA